MLHKPKLNAQSLTLEFTEKLAKKELVMAISKPAEKKVLGFKYWALALKKDLKFDPTPISLRQN